MISRCGLIWWIRFPTDVYMAAKSVWSPVPHVGLSSCPPTFAERGSFLISIAATSGLEAYRLVMFCQATVNVWAGYRSLNHRPLVSLLLQHQPKSSRWQLGMTIRPLSVSALTQASNTSSGVDPYRSGLAARYCCGTGAVCSVIHTLNGNRTQLNPCAAMRSASVLRSA